MTDEALAAWVTDERKKKKEQKAKGKAKNERQLEVDEKEMEAPVRELSRMELRIKAEFDEIALRQGLVSEGYMAVAKESQEKALARLEAAEAEDKPEEFCPRCIEPYTDDEGVHHDGEDKHPNCPECGVCEDCEHLSDCSQAQ